MTGSVRRAVFAWLALMLLPAAGWCRLGIEVELGYANSYAAGAWTPIRVILENLPDPQGPMPADRDFAGRVQLRVSDYRGQTVQYEQEIDLPLQSRKRVEFEAMLSTSSSIVVDLVNRKGVSVAQRQVSPPRVSHTFGSLRHSTYVVPTVLLLQSPTETFSLPFLLDSPAANIRTITADALPSDYRGYDGVRLLAVQERLSHRMRPAQLDALDRWIKFGGQLVVVTPRQVREIREDPWLAERLPALPNGVRELTLRDLNSRSPLTPVLMTQWEGRPPAGVVVWGTEAGPAALRAGRGAGAVYALGIDPSGFGPVELATPVGRELQALLDVWVLGPDRGDLRARHVWSTADVDPDFTEVMLLPNLWVVTALIVMFVVVVGPLNFLMLRRRRQLELAWATIPGLSIVFFAAVYGYGVWAKGGDQHFASIDMIHAAPGSSEALLLSSQIQFAPRKETYRLMPPPDGAVLPLLQYYEDPASAYGFNLANAFAHGTIGGAPADARGMATLVQEEGGGRRLMAPVDQWTMQFYQVEAPLKLEGQVEGSVLLVGEDRVELRLRNGLPTQLLEAVIYLGEDAYPVGPIGPGLSLKRVLARSGVIPMAGAQPMPSPGDDKSAFAASADYLLRQGGARSYPHFRVDNPQRAARLVAWLPDWRNPVRVEPEPEVAKAHGLLEVHLPVAWEGARTLTSRSTLRRRVYWVDSPNTQVEDPSLNVFCRLRDSAAEILVGPAWPATRASFLAGTLGFAFTRHTEDLSVSVYNYRTGRWHPVYEAARDAAVKPDVEQICQFPIDAAWVNPVEPMLRLRFESHPASSSGGGGAGGMVFSANYGVSLGSVDAVMTLMAPPPDEGESARRENPPSGPEPGAGANASGPEPGQPTVAEDASNP